MKLGEGAEFGICASVYCLSGSGRVLSDCCKFSSGEAFSLEESQIVTDSVAGNAGKVSLPTTSLFVVSFFLGTCILVSL